MSFRDGFEVFRGYRHPSFRIVQRRRWWFTISGVLILLSVIGLLSGLNFTIDFTGGTQLLYEDRAGVSVEEVRATLARDPYNREGVEVQILGGNQVSVRTSALTDLSTEDRAQLIDDLAAQAGVDATDISQQVVGPTWGEQISRQAAVGLVIVLIAIAIYITFRFEWKMAIGAIAAVVHDVVITAGVFGLSGRRVSPATVIAILTILGFSLYDTVVIYDKVKENTESPTLLAKDTYEGVANFSMNQVLMRSVNTSLVVVMPILSLLFFGGETLKDFAFAMMIGTITGAYSSIFIATPILAILKEREPRYQQLRARLESRPGAERRLRVVAAPPSEEEAEERAEVARASVGSAAATRATARSGQGGQRPRPKSRRKPPAKRKRR